MRYIDSEEFLRKAKTIPVIDVRSPGEFNHGHIPGAVNIPLFTDEERAIVGTNYKKQGRKYSIRKGLELIGPKMAGFVKEADKLQSGEELLIHCWRGGMRSGSMAWLMETAGFACDVLLITFDASVTDTEFHTHHKLLASPFLSLN